MQRLLVFPTVLVLAAASTLFVSVASTEAATPTKAPAAETPADILTPPADAEKLPSGLVTKVLKAGTGDSHPDANDVVQAHYIGRSPDGKVFLSTYDSGQPGTFPLDKVFPGWSEGMQLMVVGEKRRLWIPKNLGPKNPTKGPEGAAIFDVELLGFFNMPNPPASMAVPDPKAKKLPGGASILTALPGEAGGKSPAADDVAVVHFIQWDAQGTVLDSTYARNRPVGIPLDKVLPAFAEAIADMVPGEHRFVWIPRNVHDQQWPKAPDGMMILRVQLVKVMPAATLQAPPGTPMPSGPGGG